MNVLSDVLCSWSDDFKIGSNTLWHYCPACEQVHPIPPRWQFDGNLACPTFTPSFRQHLGSGDCHYNLTKGRIVWHGDCWHKRSGSEPMVSLADKLLSGPYDVTRS